MRGDSSSGVRPVRGFGRAGWVSVAVLVVVAVVAWSGLDLFELGLRGAARVFGAEAPMRLVGYWYVWVRFAVWEPRLSVLTVLVLLPALWARPGPFGWGRVLVLAGAALVLPVGIRWGPWLLVPELDRLLGVSYVEPGTGMTMRFPAGRVASLALLDALVIAWVARSVGTGAVAFAAAVAINAILLVAAVFGGSLGAAMPPYWVFGIAWNALVGGFALRAAWHARRRAAPSHGLRCPACGYDTGRAVADRCPECGAAFETRSSERAADRADCATPAP